MKLPGLTAMITGGASGMGAATARKLAAAGVNVSLLDVNIDAAKKIATDINGIAFPCDVTHSADIETAIVETIHHFGPINVCINCAGIVHSRRMVNKQGTIALEEFQRVIGINLVGTFNIMRLVTASMIASTPTDENYERGVIINTASIAAFEGQIGQTAYSASKGAIAAMTLPAARELAQFGIRVMTIAPGLVDTPMFDKLSPDTKATLAASVPFPKRLATPDEFALLACHIIENPMLNGEIIRLDGALRMPPS